MKRNKAGFSLLEVVVTFTVIMIVSITAFTVFSTSGNSIIKAVKEKEATTYLTSALEVYKYYGEADGVKTELGLSDPDGEGYYKKSFDGGYFVRFKIDGEGFSGHCYDEDGEIIFTVSPYLKGVFVNESD